MILSCESNLSKKLTLSQTTQPCLVPSSKLLPLIKTTTQPGINCNDRFVQIELQTDYYGSETRWVFSDTESGAIVLQGENNLGMHHMLKNAFGSSEEQNLPCESNHSQKPSPSPTT